MNKSRPTAKLLGMFLAVVLVLNLIPLSSAQAAGAFGDISETDYYYSEVTAMCTQGVISGYPDGTFLPQNPVTNAEALKLVCSMAAVNYAGFSGKADPWYSDVFAWAVDNGVISSGTEPNAYATREEICQYIVSVYQLPYETDADVFSDTYSAAGNTLYYYGVIKGIPNGDGTVSFGGGQSVKRCDACIMLYRLSRQVENPDWTEADFSLDRSHYYVSRPSSLTDFDDYIQAWDYMLCNLDYEDTFQVSVTCTPDELDEMMDDIQTAYYFAMFDYMEYASFLTQWGVTASYVVSAGGLYMNPSFTLELSNTEGLSLSEVTDEIAAFDSACEDIVTGLYEDGELTSGMTDEEKAYALYTYMAYNTRYDTSCTYYNGYDAAVRHTAVCQGYTSMYNYLCNLAGVNMEAMTGDTGGEHHSWSRIYEDGAYYNVDTTWADPVPDEPYYCDYTWFWVTDEYMKTCGAPRTFDIDSLVYG